jgi:RND family efflux transporter MFP subunit
MCASVTECQRGRVIASLTQGDTSANIASQKALRDAAQARLDELRRGARPEEIAIAESQLSTAQSQKNQAEAVLTDVLNEAYVKLDDVVRTKTDQFFTNPRTSSPQLIHPTDSSVKVSVENDRAQLESDLQTLALRTISIPTDEDIKSTKVLIQKVRNYLDSIALAVGRFSAYTSLPQTTIDGYSALVAGARTTNSAYLTAITSASTAYNNAVTAVKTAENQLAQKKSGAGEEAIRVQAAQVRAAEAALNNAYSQSGKRVIIAPFTGTATSVDVKEGQIVSSATGTVTLISASRLQVEAYVPEVYVAKIKIGNDADVTLDAYGSDQVFKAKVSSIDPAATKRDGISTYKVVLALQEPDSRIKSGMGGDITIKTKSVSSVITIPKNALIQRNGKYYVQIPSGVENRVVEREINVGKLNEAGIAEVVGGLTDGDVIVRNPIQ